MSMENKEVNDIMELLRAEKAKSLETVRLVIFEIATKHSDVIDLITEELAEQLREKRI